MYGVDINYRTLMSSMSQATQLEVWSWCFSKYVGVNTFITNPFRVDTHPFCKLREHQGILFLSDYAMPEYSKWTCLHGVRELLSRQLNRYVGLNEAANYTHTCLFFNKRPNFGISVITGATIKGRPNKSDIYFIPHTNAEGKACFIQRDADYWTKRFVTSDQLEDSSRGGRVFSPKTFFINNTRFVPKDVCIIYTMSLGKMKVYQPYQDKKFKWFSTVSKNDYWYTQRGSNKLLIIKAQKDHLVAENIFLDWDIYSGINETMFSPDLPDIIKEHTTVWTLMDNDTTGLKASLDLQEQFGTVPHIIDSSTGYKDLDEFVISCKELPLLENCPIIKLIK